MQSWWTMNAKNPYANKNDADNGKNENVLTSAGSLIDENKMHISSNETVL